MKMLTLLAMAGPGGPDTQQSPLMMPMMLVLMMGMFYVLIIRPQQRRERARRAMLDAVKTGDRVVFGGGFMGIVTNVKDKTCLVRIADNVKVEVVRGAISQILGKDDAPTVEPAR